MNVTRELKVCTKEELGINILDGIMPEITRLDGVDEPVTVRIANPTSNLEYLKLIADNNYDFHIDIDTVAYSLVYDLKESTDIETLYLSCYRPPYTVAECEIYASNAKEELFSPQNLVVSIDNNDDSQMIGEGEYRSAYFKTEGLSCRYLGFLHKKSNAKDGMSRIRILGAYNSEYTEARRFINKNYSGSCIERVEAKVTGDYSGKIEYLTDGAAFGGDKTFVANNAEIKFQLPFHKKVDSLIIIGKDLSNVFFADDESGLKEVKYTKTTCEVGELYELDVTEFGVTNTATIKLSGNVDEILIYCRSVDFKVDFDTVVTDDFMGVGANVLPCHLFEMGRMAGFNDALMQLEKRRIAISNPSVVRVWFQTDWFVMDEADYYNRKYVFNSPKMMAVYKELDAFLERGIEVEISYAWKIGYSAGDWFAFPEAFNRRDSAPRDLDQYAIGCVDLLKELIINRGYTNIKYLSFCNESNNGLPDGWDFVCPEGLHPMDHWLSALKKVHARLKSEGMDKYIDLWAAEIVGNWDTWAEFFNKNAGELYTYFTGHYYGVSYDRCLHNIAELKKHTGNRPIGITEFATYKYNKESNHINFGVNNVANMLGFINAGVSLMLYWILSGSVVDEHFVINHEVGNFWRMPTLEIPKSVASENYYNLTLFTNYIKKHSKVYKTITSDAVHASVIESADGDITVFAELKATEKDKQLNIDLGKEINKKFYKHVYTRDIEREANLIIPPVVAELDVKDSISEKAPSDYCLIVYTTIPPVRQVVMDEVFLTVKHGEEIKLNAKVIDGEGDIKWSLVEYNHTYGLNAEVTEDGVFKSLGRYQIRRAVGYPQFAVKAELPTGEYGIAIVTVLENEKIKDSISIVNG